MVTIETYQYEIASAMGFIPEIMAKETRILGNTPHWYRIETASFFLLQEACKKLGWWVFYKRVPYPRFLASREFHWWKAATMLEDLGGEAGGQKEKF